jgi:NAD(P)-dependent dehydrogenase (short-subunit alcohol dehydrogenase family)
MRVLPLVGALLAGGVVLRQVIRALVPPATFRGQVVLITGGSRGLGFALARCFAAEGATVALLARSDDQLRAAAHQLRADGASEVLTFACDVRDAPAVVRAVERLIAQTGHLDVLVNNAGVISVMPLVHAQREDFATSLDTHFWGPYNLIEACLPQFRRQGAGRIVNIASIGGRVAVPHLLPYTVGKFALVGLSEGLRTELGREGISVTTVTPHVMQTGSHRNVLVRGRHAQEATWFALGTASRLTALDAAAAARRIVEAARARRATVTPGWPARVAELSHALAPAVTAAAASAVNALLLPRPSTGPEGDQGRQSRSIDLGRVSWLFATDAARRFNQPLAADEAARTSAPARVVPTGD